MTNVFQSLLLVIAGATQKELLPGSNPSRTALSLSRLVCPQCRSPIGICRNGSCWTLFAFCWRYWTRPAILVA
jgi:hypothetical protein